MLVVLNWSSWWYLLTLSFPLYTSQYDWKIKCPNCGGYSQSQSPIDIVSVSRAMIYTPALGPLGFRGWCQSLTGEWTNNAGHTLKFSPLNNQPQAYLDSYGQRGFVFKQFHLYWGSNRGQGSQYTLLIDIPITVRCTLSSLVVLMGWSVTLCPSIKSDPSMYNIIILHKWVQFNQYMHYNEKNGF